MWWRIGALVALVQLLAVIIGLFIGKIF
jgi:hypothetical protein